jgi:alkylhydroperoxidase family enzyme
VDVNSAVGRKQGLSDQQLAELSDFERSSSFNPAERAALRYAEQMCRTPVDVPDSVFEELRRHFDSGQIVELTAMVALENLRARFNRALQIPSDSLCPLPADHPVRLRASGT